MRSNSCTLHVLPPQRFGYDHSLCWLALPPVLCYRQRGCMALSLIFECYTCLYLSSAPLPTPSRQCVFLQTFAMLQVTTGARVALRNDSYTLHLLLPTKVDPLVSLMKVEKVPDSTYDMIGGLDQQIKEIKEVRWLRGGCIPAMAEAAPKKMSSGCLLLDLGPDGSHLL